ncbi:hypothetical protein [Paenibacillus illinoisensis]|nr:hypothetical protein [Paenibacillus illinoisensis]
MSAATRAASKPEGPPPTTTIFFGVSAGSMTKRLAESEKRGQMVSSDGG